MMVREQRAKIPKPDWRRKLDGGFENAYLNGDEASDLDDLAVLVESIDHAPANEGYANVKTL